MVISRIAQKIFGSSNKRQLRACRERVASINALEPELEKLSDEDIVERSSRLRIEVSNGRPLKHALIEAFALVREAAKRTIGQRHFDVQLVGGMILHDGAIAEMKTGEGKTLVATLAVYLNTLAQKGVHVVTVNDYLARRDSEWMGQIYRFLGLSVGTIVHGLSDEERKSTYACDITYGTNNEFGFDYLRDNMKHELSEMVQREHHFAIVDEVDSILIDEARTPLIISGAIDDKVDLYTRIDALIPSLEETDYEKDDKSRSVSLSEQGNESAERLLIEYGIMENGSSLYEISNVALVHHVNQALRAHTLFLRDKDYIVKDGQVVIIDEFTGRMMPGRRYSEGLHQALEAKEDVDIQPENQTLASITFQNYFRLYDKLSGMTGTALTEASEFLEIYDLEVIEIPTNLPVIRKDEDDVVFRTSTEKFRAIVEDIRETSAKGQPILVGTTSIDKSEHLSALLKAESIPHQVLNARYHEQEAQIIANAGVAGNVTIATNMAGRGTDIQLGGNLDARLSQLTASMGEDDASPGQIEEIRTAIEANRKTVHSAGGLYVIGTERHESRRVDNQLRGRSGRQNDPGLSRFYLSLEDDLMRIFGSERMDGMLQKLGIEENEAVVHPWINRALAKAQQRVEARNFDMRKNILKYDDVLNDQRKVIYEQRIGLMALEDVSESIRDFRHDTIDNLIKQFIPEDSYPEQWNVESLSTELAETLHSEVPVREWASEEGIGPAEIKSRIESHFEETFSRIETSIGETTWRKVEKIVLMREIDNLWREHIITLEQLRQVIGYRGYAQRDPLNEYKSEAFMLFQNMLSSLKQAVIGRLARVQVADEIEPPSLPDELSAHHIDPITGEDEVKMADEAAQSNFPADNTWRSTANRGASKIRRNAPCPCGSKRKYKHCHGRF